MKIIGTHKEVKKLITKIKKTNECKYKITCISNDCNGCDCTIIPIDLIDVQYTD